MDNLFFIWGVALFGLLTIEKITNFLGIPDPTRKIILFVAAVLAILWLLVVFVGLNIGL